MGRKMSCASMPTPYAGNGQYDVATCSSVSTTSFGSPASLSMKSTLAFCAASRNGLPRRFCCSGVHEFQIWSAASGRSGTFHSGVFITPGSMSTTCTPQGASSRRSASLRPITANFDALYALSDGVAKRPAALAMLITRPLALMSAGMSGLVTLKMPNVFTFSCRRTSLSGASSARPARSTPALLSSTSRPSGVSRSMSGSAARIDSSLVTSSTNGTTFLRVFSSPTASLVRHAASTL
mmetsp:Transcript_8490/g.20146  ORF Transcript_8490/g.20146 Transcript_8490/m.20146 type:complete len:238 (-) Transcript_8490:227-940(-)